MKEEKVGVVSHYFNHVGVAAVVLDAGLSVGDTIHVKGHSTDFTQTVDSIQIEHRNLSQAKKGDDVGIKVRDHVREHDVLYKVTGD